MGMLNSKQLQRVSRYSRIFALISIIGATVGVAGCVHEPGYYGPPPHTHFHPDYYDYYYYPSVGVYFHFTSGYYYYRTEGSWIRSRTLPSYIHIDPRYRVKIRVDSDKPYRYYDKHKRRFAPDRRHDHGDKDRDVREREANRKWYREQKAQPKPRRHDDGHRGDRDKGDRRHDRNNEGNKRSRDKWDDDDDESPKKRPWYR